MRNNRAVIAYVDKIIHTHHDSYTAVLRHIFRFELLLCTFKTYQCTMKSKPTLTYTNIFWAGTSYTLAFHLKALPALHVYLQKSICHDGQWQWAAGESITCILPTCNLFQPTMPCAICLIYLGILYTCCILQHDGKLTISSLILSMAVTAEYVINLMSIPNWNDVALICITAQLTFGKDALMRSSQLRH